MHGSMSDMATVLVVEDEPGIRSSLRRGLEAEGHLVQEAQDGATGLVQALSPRVQLVILDLGLPKLAGDDVLDLVLAQRPQLPILVLTARDAVEDRVRALDAGAIDYIVKPFALAELMARVRLRLRDAPQPTSLRHGRVTLNLVRRHAEVVGQEVALTTQEAGLLQQFLQHPEETLSRGQLLRSVWGLEQAPRRSNLVDVGVATLRKKLGVDCIETVRGEGYRFLG
jgi:DNA-binding response OmpR family regulator